MLHKKIPQILYKTSFSVLIQEDFFLASEIKAHIGRLTLTSNYYTALEISEKQDKTLKRHDFFLKISCPFFRQLSLYKNVLRKFKLSL